MNISKDVELMQHPNKWPSWPLLPLVKRQEQEPGFLIAEGKPRVYVCSIFETAERACKTLEDVREKIAYIQYNSYQEVVEDGWEVD